MYGRAAVYVTVPREFCCYIGAQLSDTLDVHRSYLRDPWNIMDIVCVTTAWIPYMFPDAASGSALRSFRLLRPLRSISRFAGLKRLVQTIMLSIPQMGNIGDPSHCRHTAPKSAGTLFTFLLKRRSTWEGCAAD